LLGDFAMTTSQLFLQSCSGLARTLAGAGIGPGALAAHGQATTVAEAAVAADVHQALDVHRGFTTQVTFDGEQGDLLTDFFQIAIGQVFDLFGVGDVACFANFASARATDAKDSSQADFGVLLRRNIDTSDTSHVRPLKLLKSALTLFVAWVRADHTDNALATDNLAIAANLLDRS
jgi:hypothetical protein